MEEKNPTVVDGLENKENNEQNSAGEEKPENNVKGADEKPEGDNKVAKEGEENNHEENPTDHDDDDDDDFIKALLSDDDEDDDDEVQRQKNRDAEAARKRREAEAKAKAEEEAKKKAEEEARVKAEQEAKLKAESEAKAKAENEDENPQKQLGKQLVAFHEKYPDIDLKQLDNDVAFKKFIDGKILGKKDFTALYEDYLEIKSNISGKAVEEVSRNYNKQKASSGSSKGSSNPDTGSLYSQKELQEIERRLPFMSAKEANAIMSKYTKSVDYHSKK